MIADQGYYVPAILDTEGEIAASHGVDAFPTEIFIDSEGVVVNVQVGGLSAADLWAAVAGMVTATTASNPSTTLPPSASTSATIPTTSASSSTTAPPTPTPDDGPSAGLIALIAILAVLAAAVVALLGFRRRKR